MLLFCLMISIIVGLFSCMIHTYIVMCPVISYVILLVARYTFISQVILLIARCPVIGQVILLIARCPVISQVILLLVWLYC